MSQPTIEQFLREHYVDSVFHTHVSMVQPRGKFQFNRQGLEHFWDLYCTRIHRDGQEAILGIAEKPQDNTPILVDIDIKLRKADVPRGSGCDDHLYTRHQLHATIAIYQQALREIVHDCTDDLLLCVVLEKPIYETTAGASTYLKNGFHLHFPNLFLPRVDQEVHLIPLVQQRVKDAELYASLGFADSSAVIDKACCTVPWLLYGSRKAENMLPYTATAVVDATGAQREFEDALRGYELFDIDEEPIPVEGRVVELLPRILSILPYGRAQHATRPEITRGLRDRVKVDALSRASKERYNHNGNRSALSVEQALKVSAVLLPMLADERADDRNEWMTVGWILYNIGDGSPEALEQWMDFSSRNKEKYDEMTCIFEWNRMVRKQYTLGTLKYYAGIDNPEEFAKFKQANAQEHVRQSLNGSHNDIAKVLYEEYGTEFVCSSITSKTWYQFRGHHWVNIDSDTFLRARISGEVVGKYKDMSTEIFGKMAATEDKAEETMYNERIKQVFKIVRNLKTSPFKDNVMKEAREVFFDERFQSRLNQDPNLVAFSNGVYDLKVNTFRNGRPEDFISEAVPIEYVEHADTDDAVCDVVEFLRKVFPDESVRTYFLDMYSDIFVGGNTQKKLLMWTGEGDNAKSITQKLFERMLGRLAIKFNTQSFTGNKPQSGAANPEMSRAAPPVRHATMEEPDGHEQLNIGELKKLTGGDSYWARDLFQTGKETREVFPMFMLTFICNKLPRLRYSDKATWNRIRVIPFESTFVEPGQPCPRTFEEQMAAKRFPMDKEFGHKIPGMVTAFAWYLLEWRKKVTVRVEPDKVKEATDMYRRQNDIYKQFVGECIVEDAKGAISLAEMYAHFKEWFREGFANMTLPIKNELKEYFAQAWGDPARGCRWRGYRLRTERDDADDASMDDGVVATPAMAGHDPHDPNDPGDDEHDHDHGDYIPPM